MHNRAVVKFKPYRGLRGSVYYSENVVCGEILDIPDTIKYSGLSLSDCYASFIAAVDKYKDNKITKLYGCHNEGCSYCSECFLVEPAIKLVQPGNEQI